jgi:hypothetical protein
MVILFLEMNFPPWMMAWVPVKWQEGYYMLIRERWDVTWFCRFISKMPFFA